MAFSAFKSTSKRGNLVNSSSSSSRTNTRLLINENTENNSNDKLKTAPMRRSRSVSAISRTLLEPSTEFLNKRDNPLFWSSGSPPEKETDSKIKRNNDNATVVSKSDDRRGRSVSRNATVSKTSNSSGRSLSRADTGRTFRSVSRNPVSRNLHGSSESEVEQEGNNTMSSYRVRSNMNVVTNDVKKADLVRSSSDLSDHVKSPRTWSSLHPLMDSPASTSSVLQIPGCEDGGSISSLSEVEEKTINAVSEQMKTFKGVHGDTASEIYETVRSEVRRAISDIQFDLESAIRRNNSNASGISNVISTPPNSVKQGPVELVLDIRREYAKELEQSQERSRKLRADLAAEEHRGQELSRILKEMLPDPTTSNLQRSRPGRKNSIERRKVSKRLTEEAMAYFDECVSISTFDSSDISSAEDQFLNLVGATAPVNESVSLVHGNSPTIHSPAPSTCLNQKSLEDYGLTGSSNSNEPTRDLISPNSTNKENSQKFQFSFCRKPAKSFTFQEDIRNYVKDFENGKEKDDLDSMTVRSKFYDVDEYKMQAQEQSFLFDRVLLKNRIGSGSLVVCGGITYFLSPFASFL